jgi:hypothetical protein
VNSLIGDHHIMSALYAQVGSDCYIYQAFYISNQDMQCKPPAEEGYCFWMHHSIRFVQRDERIRKPACSIHHRMWGITNPHLHGFDAFLHCISQKVNFYQQRG